MKRLQSFSHILIYIQSQSKPDEEYSMIIFISRTLLVSAFLFADVIFIIIAPWCQHVFTLVTVLSIPELFNSAIGMGKKNRSLILVIGVIVLTNIIYSY